MPILPVFHLTILNRFQDGHHVKMAKHVRYDRTLKTYNLHSFVSKTCMYKCQDYMYISDMNISVMSLNDGVQDGRHQDF